MSRVPHNPHGMKPVNLVDIWEDLSRGIRHIYSRESMPKKRYMELYTYPVSQWGAFCVNKCPVVDKSVKSPEKILDSS